MIVDSIEDQYYGDDDALPQTPRLKAVVVSYKPSPTPPLLLTVHHPPPRIQNVSPSSTRRPKKANRRKNRPTQGDLVLIREMAPNLPEIAQLASETALNSDSASGSEDEEMSETTQDMQPTPVVQIAPESRQSTSNANPNSGGLPTISEVFKSVDDSRSTLVHRDSVIQDDIRPDLAERRASQNIVVSNPIHGSRQSTKNGDMTAPSLPIIGTSPNAPDLSRTTSINGQTSKGSITSSTSLQQLTIPQRPGPHADTLPAMQMPSPAGDSAVSPAQHQTLPGFHALDNIARSANSEHEAGRANSFVHRQSISSVGTSPSSIVRQLSISSHSPATPFPPLSASSPVSVRDDPQRGDVFLRSGGGGFFGADGRRPSHAASDNGPYPPTLHSTTTNDSYHSPEGLSPGTQPTPIEGRPRHMSLDGALATRLLPPPPGSGIQHIPSHGSGTFRCDWPGCNAAPFQTQYLLK